MCQGQACNQITPRPVTETPGWYHQLEHCKQLGDQRLKLLILYNSVITLHNCAFVKFYLEFKMRTLARFRYSRSGVSQIYNKLPFEKCRAAADLLDRWSHTRPMVCVLSCVSRDTKVSCTTATHLLTSHWGWETEKDFRKFTLDWRHVYLPDDISSIS